MSRRSALLAGLLVAAAPLAAEAGERIVLVPLENLTRAAGAREAFMPTLAIVLERKGYEIVTGEAVESYLREKRIRYLDSLPTTEAKELLERTGADAMIVGSVLSYERRRADPAVALSLTIIGPDGEVIWSDVGGITASASRGPLDLKKTSDPEVLAIRLVYQMLEDLPSGNIGGARRTSAVARGPRVFRSREFVGANLKICVLPLQNLSPARDAARIIESAVLHHLSSTGRVTVVPPADLRQHVVATGLRAPSRLGLDQLQRLAKTAGTPYFLLGTIFAYDAGTGRDGTPTVEIYLRLLDVESGRTVWSGLHRRAGADYERLLRLGAVRDPATLASHTAGELVAAFTKR